MSIATIQETIDRGNVSIYLSGNDNSKGNLFGQRIAAPGSPVTIALVTDALTWGMEIYPLPVSAVNATSTVTIDDIGDDGESIEGFIDDPILGSISLGSYTKDSGDTTPTILASSIAAVWYTNAYGYGVTCSLGVIAITARAGLGATINGGGRVSVVVTPAVFSPDDIANLWGWYESGVGVSGTTSVTQWNDQSVNGHNLLADISPKLTLNVINGYPVIEPRTGIGARMLPISNFPIGDYTIFVVGSQSVSGSPLTDEDGVFLYSAGNDMIISRGGTNNTISGAGFGLTKSASNDTFYTIRNKYLITGSNGYYLALNNGSEGYHAGSGSISADQLLVFANGFNNFGNKKIAEIIIYTRGLTAPEVTQVETYLQTKYNHY